MRCTDSAQSVFRRRGCVWKLDNVLCGGVFKSPSPVTFWQQWQLLDKYAKTLDVYQAKKKKKPVWERRETHTKKQCRDTTEKKHWNTPESLPGSVSRSNQNGFIKQFVHTWYKLCGTKIKSEFFEIQIYAIVQCGARFKQLLVMVEFFNMRLVHDFIIQNSENKNHNIHL